MRTGSAVCKNRRPIKRESGENPEQSRCCKLRLNGTEIYATNPVDWEGLGCRSKSEDLPCVLSARLARYELRHDEKQGLKGFSRYIVIVSGKY